jgi:hypothetical protein
MGPVEFGPGVECELFVCLGTALRDPFFAT